MQSEAERKTDGSALYGNDASRNAEEWAGQMKEWAGQMEELAGQMKESAGQKEESAGAGMMEKAAGKWEAEEKQKNLKSKRIKRGR